MALFISYRLKRILFKVLRKRFVLLTLVFLVLWVTGASLFYVAERPGIDYWTSLYWALITMATVGYGDVVPTTPLGRLVAGLTAIFGIATYTLLVSTLADYFMEATVKAAMGLGSLRDKRIVVIGEGPLCEEAVDEIVANGLGDETGWLRETQPREEPPVDYIVGEISERSMRRAGIDRAEHVIICYEDDSKNIHASALVRKINPKAKITTIVKDRTALDILVMLGVDYVLPLSILGRLLVSTTFEPSVTRFIADAASAKGGADLVEIEGEGGRVEELEEKHRVRAIAVVEEDGSVRPVRRGETIPRGKKVVAVREAEEKGG